MNAGRAIKRAQPLTSINVANIPSPSSVLEGVLAVNKPSALTSAQVLRDIQQHFTPSKLFRPWLDREYARRDNENHNQKKRRRNSKKDIQVKMGHGGTLDPLATGVLILGVGNGTKSLRRFLECTKSYETVLIFGAATDTYDTEGQVVARKGYSHITRLAVEKALESFRGRIMQKPPLFSALRIEGKRLYEYAREGKPLPREIAERPVEVRSLELVEWMEGGTHEWHWPEKEAGKEEKEVVGRVLRLAADPETEAGAGFIDATAGAKRKREDEETVNGAMTEASDQPSTKYGKLSPNPVVSGTTQDAAPGDEELVEDQPLPSTEVEPMEVPSTTADTQARESRCPGPAIRLHMTVTSGFYVRSLCHDLGASLNSLGIMASLVRTRQEEFELGKNVLEYDDLANGEELWGPKVREMLEEWMRRDPYTRGSAVEEGRTRKQIGGCDATNDDREVVAKRRRNTSSPED